MATRRSARRRSSTSPGTNGKGSTVAFLRGILEAAGKRVHVDTSPHLVRVNERIRLAGRLVDDETLVATLLECERANNGETLSVWELLTAAAFLLFSRVPADYTLLEVGLGGRFDATNVVTRPLATVITPISMDHPEFLGATVDKIAFEKAGIIKAGAPVIVAEQTEDALRVIERRAMELRVTRRVADRDFHMRAENGRLVYEDTAGLARSCPSPASPAAINTATRRPRSQRLRLVAPDLPADAFEQGLLDARWPARLQRLRSGPLVARAPAGAEMWLDGGHNEAGGRVLAEAMADFEEQQPRSLVLITGSLSSKDTGAFLTHFKGLAREAIAIPIPGEHASRPPEEVAEFASRAGLSARDRGERRRGARYAGGGELAEAAARADRGLALSGGGGAEGERQPARVNVSPTAGCAARRLRLYPGSVFVRVRTPALRETLWPAPA